MTKIKEERVHLGIRLPVSKKESIEAAALKLSHELGMKVTVTSYVLWLHDHREQSLDLMDNG